MYNIHWKSIITGATGHGTGEFTKQEAQQIADELNIKYEGALTHWVESTTHEQETKYAAPANG